MNIVVPKLQYVQDLKRSLSHFDNYSAVIIHTDLIKMGYLDRRGSRDEVCASHLDTLLEVFAGKTIIFPTYNYDFYQNRVYDVANDPCQIGTLNEYARRQFTGNRSLTPVFNYVVINGDGYDMGFRANPFGKEDIFWQAMQRGALVCMLGTGYDHATFQHLAEEEVAVPYRYKKPFHGIVKTQSESLKVLYEPPLYPIDPAIRELIVYRWEYMQEVLEWDKALVRAPLGRTRSVIFDTEAHYNLYVWLMRKNVLFALTEQSQHDVMRYMHQRKIDRMTVENMEPGWNPEAPSGIIPRP